MQLFKPTSSKSASLVNEAPVWLTGSAIYAALKR